MTSSDPEHGGVVSVWVIVENDWSNWNWRWSGKTVNCKQSCTSSLNVVFYLSGSIVVAHSELCSSKYRRLDPVHCRRRMCVLCQKSYRLEGREVSTRFRSAEICSCTYLYKLSKPGTRNRINEDAHPQSHIRIQMATIWWACAGLRSTGVSSTQKCGGWHQSSAMTWFSLLQVQHKYFHCSMQCIEKVSRWDHGQSSNDSYLMVGQFK